MPLKDILVHLDNSAHEVARLELAVELARRHDAHLTGLHVLDVSAAALASQVAGMGDAAAMAVMMQRATEEAQALAVPIEAHFRNRLAAEGLVGEWRVLDGGTKEDVAEHAKYADLTILGQPDPGEDTNEAAQLIEHVLFNSGRPLLIMPYAGKYPRIATNVLIGWNGSREAARAVGDALPLLVEAEAVTVLAISSNGAGDEAARLSADTMATHLARHGVKAVSAHTVADGISGGDALLNYAADSGSDLLVMGGYGHSRWREMLLGGVTRSLLQHMTVPVFMTH